LQTKLRIRNELGRALLGEFLGTFVLVLTIACVCAQAIIPKPALNQTIGVNLGVGLGIAFGVAICAKISGGHINPAVSLMFLSFRQLAPIRFALYSLVQLLGAFFGAAIAYLVYCVVATAVFCLLIAHITDKRNHYPTWVQPFLVGTSFVLVGTSFAYNAGYNNYGWFWIPIIAPFIGALLGAWIYQFFIGIHVPTDEQYEIVTTTITTSQHQREMQPLAPTKESTPHNEAQP
uniref:Aquaporin n=1 Tax=Meloidogyne floridensis TaxID=298350 RepID=A0A915P3L3_9BILA